MTAEIAILNKSAVALAADSAITIGSGREAKIYNTVNKIFELSDKQPLALMIYGNLEFMELPIETVAKLFRRDVGNQVSFRTVRECAEKVLEYLETQVPLTDPVEKRNRLGIVRETLTSAAAGIDQAIFDQIRKQAKYLRSKSNSIAQNVIDVRVARLNLEPPSDCFQGGSDAALLRGIENDVDDLISLSMDSVLNTVTATTRASLRRLARAALYRAPLSERRTGFVVAGFGADEICPSLEWIETDGVIRSKLKLKHMKSVDIGRDKSGAEILPFAQGEMVARFLRGVDPVYDSYIHQRVEESLRVFASQILSMMIGDLNRRKSVLRALLPAIENIRQDFHDESRNHQFTTYEQDVRMMVRFMPKQELANLAKSLIDLTSLKRRVSRELETVGGEVDVAVISKSEGLVWINRQHYFPSELNPRFYKRHYS